MNLFPVPVLVFSPPEVWGRRAGVPSRGDPSPCRRSPVKPERRRPSPPTSPLHPPTPCARLEGAGAGRRQLRGEERVAGRTGERGAGSGRVRERKGPAPGPGSQVTPACRPGGGWADPERLSVTVEATLRFHRLEMSHRRLAWRTRGSGGGSRSCRTAVRAQRRQPGAKKPTQDDGLALLLA